MRASTFGRGSLLALAILTGCASGLKHTRVVPPPDAAVQVSPDLVTKVGQITSLAESGGVLYVGGKNGVAAVAGDGKLQWATELPYAHLRYLDVRRDVVAYTSYVVKGIEKGGVAKSIFMGALADAPEYADCRAGVLTTGGEKRWEFECGDRAASPPAIGDKTIAYSVGEMLAILSLADGKLVASPTIFANSLGGLGKGIVNRASYNRPAFLKGHYTAAHMNVVLRTTEEGKITDSSSTYSILPPRGFENITVGPVVVKDIVVVGNNREKGNNGELLKSRVFALEGNNSKAWYDNLDDKLSAVCSMTVASETVFLTTNFHAYAYSSSGKQLWHQENGGALHPGNGFRGVAYINTRGLSVPTRKSQGRLLQSDGKKVYLTSGYHTADAITVLDAKTGEYVQSIDMKDRVVDMAVIGPKLAVATLAGLQLLPLLD